MYRVSSASEPPAPAANFFWHRAALPFIHSPVITPHSAAPHALGYLYQVRHALLALLKDDREEAAVSLEGLDDVSVEVYSRLEGWWFPKVVAHLIGQSSQPITRLELREAVCDITSKFRHDSLPLDFELARPDEPYFAAHENRQFVRQLRQLNINLNRIRFAVIDYYRAFEQRTRWAQEDLLIDDELFTYEQKLKEQWERWIADITDEFDDLEDSNQCVKFGQQVYDAMRAASLPIRLNMPTGHEYVMRGSYHMLADEQPPHVYWHPKFLDQLAQLQAVAAAS
nr:hypothetical protein [Tanacetum cinerariifolium]